MSLPERVDIEYSWFEPGRRNGFYPLCTVHGQMRRREDEHRWVCVGFDGEGCTARVADEEISTYLREDPLTM